MNNQKKILVVDDEADIRTLLSVRFRANDYNVLTAEDGEKGLETALRELPDLIILDISMPKLNGMEVLQRLRNDPRTRKTPVIMLTASGDSKSILMAQELHATDYFGKPFDADELLKFICRYMAE